MNFLRFDQSTADWVIYAPLRKLRPQHERRPLPPSQDAVRDTKEFCPFCPGNEKMTPSEIYAVRPPGQSGVADWNILRRRKQISGAADRGGSKAARGRRDVSLDGGLRRS